MIEQKYATFLPRFGAGIIDGVIFFYINWLLLLAYQHTEIVLLKALIYLVNSSLLTVYSIWMHGKFGQTLGKMVCKVIVLDASEQPLTMRQAVLRDILSVVLIPISLAMDIPRIILGIDIYAPANYTFLDLVLFYSTSVWFAVEIITMLTNSKRRALHDFIAGSVVIRKPSRASEPAPTDTINPLPQTGAQ